MRFINHYIIGNKILWYYIIRNVLKNVNFFNFIIEVLILKNIKNRFIAETVGGNHSRAALAELINSDSNFKVGRDITTANKVVMRNCIRCTIYYNLSM